MRKKGKRRLGITLVEVMVYAMLLGIVFTGIYGVFVSSMRYYRVTEARTTLHQNAISAMGNFFNEFPGTKSSSVIIGNNPTGVIFLSARKNDGNYEFDSNGNLKWQRWVCYYLSPVGSGSYNLIRKEAVIANPSANPGACPYANISAFASANLPSDYIARGVQSMTITKGTMGNYSIVITFDQTTDITKPNRLQVATQIHARN